MMVEMKDWRGTPIIKGSIIVYPGRHRSHMYMMEGEVLETMQVWEWGQFKWALRVLPLRQGQFGRTNMRPVKLTALERVTVVDNPTMNMANKVGWPNV